MPTVSLAQVAAHIDGSVKGNEQHTVSQMGNLASAQAHQLSFLSNPKYAKDLANTQAGAVIVTEEGAANFTGNAIVVADPYVGFAKAAQLLDTTPKQAQGISELANIDASAVIGEGVSIGPGAVIAAGASIGAGTTIGPNTYIGEGAQIGKDVYLRANVTIYHKVVLADKVSVHSGTVIGCDGFGYANDKGVWIKIPQTGTVIVGYATEIGAGCTIDRGAIDNTIIGKHVIIDNQVHMAHNVQIGDFSCLCGATGIAGSAIIGKYVVIAGQCAINGHISIADKVQITGNSMVTKSIKEAGVYSSGMPVLPNREWQKNTVQQRQIGKLFERVKELEAALKSKG